MNNFEIIDDLVKTGDDKSKYLEDAWSILIVDDDDEIHQATDYALKAIKIFNKPIKLHHSYSAREAFEFIESSLDLALVILDVVMEEQDSGLKLVEKIRSHEFHELRIILRTGQPGYAPELSVLSHYDINDYRTKAELTQVRLISSVTTALRSYRQLRSLNDNSRGLRLIIDGSRDIFKRKNLEVFSRGILIQLISLQGYPSSGFVCTFNSSSSESKHTDKIVSAVGSFENYLNDSFKSIEDTRVKEALKGAKKSEHGVHTDSNLGLYFTSSEGKTLFVYIETYTLLTNENINLLKLFANNIAIAFENISLISRLDTLAYSDISTDLPNMNALDNEIIRYRKNGIESCLVDVHINMISQITSVFGVEPIFRAISEIAKKFRIYLNPQPLFIATDGKADLFLLMDKSAPDIDGILQIFEKEIFVGDISLPIAVTVSISDVSSSISTDIAIRNCTSALVVAKTTPGVNVMHYTDSMTQNLKTRVVMQSRLRDSLDRKVGIDTFLQAKVNCEDGSLVAAEALCRWNLNGEHVSPDQFIPLAEMSGLSGKITYLMLENISIAVNQFRKSGLNDFPIAVNLSMHEIHTPHFAEDLLRYLGEIGLGPKNIEFEITESSLMSDSKKAKSELEKLKTAGYKIAIDDFGTGYSSLNHLKMLPVDYLKIDKSLIDILTVKNARRSLASTAITIAGQLGMKVIAEGIESKEQSDALNFLGCDYCQGYYFGRPKCISDFANEYWPNSANLH